MRSTSKQECVKQMQDITCVVRLLVLLGELIFPLVSEEMVCFVLEIRMLSLSALKLKMSG
jgi:hypothetical protein